MKRTAIDCDHCGQTDLPRARRVGLHVGWESDPAGGRSTRDLQTWDLCEECIIALAEVLAIDPTMIPLLSSSDYRIGIPVVVREDLDFDAANRLAIEIKSRVRQRRKPVRHPDLSPRG